MNLHTLQVASKYESKVRWAGAKMLIIFLGLCLVGDIMQKLFRLIMEISNVNSTQQSNIFCIIAATLSEMNKL